ncbi:MAG TPA: nucleotidyltransferase family protein [Gemmatimonadaceae bacterium]
MRPEARLLLALSRTPLLPVAEVRALAVEVKDWERALALSERHAVAQLVHRQLEAASPPGLPSRIREQFRAWWDENALRSFTLTGHLLDLVEALEARGVKPIPMKGPVLAMGVYGDIALRRFVDLDILVPRAGLPAARALLAELGFATATPMKAGAERALERSDYHVAYANRATGITVELHWALTRDVPGTHVSEHWAWWNAREVELLGRRVRALSWEALLVYLCVHGSKHGWERLAWIVDVAELLRVAPSMDWSAVATLAGECGARRMLPLGLSLARDLLGASIGAEAWRHARETASVRGLAREVRERLFDDDGAGAPGLGFQLRVRERARHRGAYLLHLLTAPHVADVEAIPLPRGSRWLYRVLRPGRLLLKRLRRAR